MTKACPAWKTWNGPSGPSNQGYRIAYSAEAEIIHVHSESWQGIHKRYTREGMAFKQIYPHATFSLGDLLRLFLKNAFNDLARRPASTSSSASSAASCASAGCNSTALTWATSAPARSPGSSSSPSTTHARTGINRMAALNGMSNPSITIKIKL